MAGPGHNSGPVAADELRAYIDRIERLEEERKALGGDIREIYAKAKGNGFDPKIMRKLVALRRMKAADREEEEALLEVYKAALGMIADMPLGVAAMKRAGVQVDLEDVISGRAA